MNITCRRHFARSWLYDAKLDKGLAEETAISWQADTEKTNRTFGIRPETQVNIVPREIAGDWPKRKMQSHDGNDRYSKNLKSVNHFWNGQRIRGALTNRPS